MSDEQMLSEDGFGGDSDYLELMSALTFSIAREVEAYGILLYRAKQFTLAVRDTPERLSK